VNAGGGKAYCPAFPSRSGPLEDTMLREIPSAPSEASPSRRGAIARGCLAAILVVGAIAVVCGMTVVRKYNQLKAGRVGAEAKWAEIDNQYKRRYDLVPNLVETVKGAANFETKTLEAVTEARASVGRAQLPSNVPTDPAQLQAYIQAQQGLGSALQRLFAVAENYPQLKATQNFLSLQDQLEGTENRITVARRDYIDAIQKYNTSTATFPGNVIAGMFNLQPMPQLQVPAEERSVPKVDFGTAGEKK
jgi:LemA protein